MLFLLPLYRLRRNAAVVGGPCSCPRWAKAGAASDDARMEITNSLFIMRAILPHDLADRAVLFIEQEDSASYLAAFRIRAEN